MHLISPVFTPPPIHPFIHPPTHWLLLFMSLPFPFPSLPFHLSSTCCLPFHRPSTCCLHPSTTLPSTSTQCSLLCVNSTQYPPHLLGNPSSSFIFYYALLTTYFFFLLVFLSFFFFLLIPTSIFFLFSFFFSPRPAPPCLASPRLALTAFPAPHSWPRGGRVGAPSSRNKGQE